MLARPFLVLLALTPAAFADEPAPKKTEPEGFVVQGRVDKDDPPDRQFGVPSKLHAQRLEKDKQYVIEVTAAQNPFLHVNDSIGNVVAHGQNRTGKSSRVRFTAPKDDVFLIYAGVHGVMPADYVLSIKPFAATPVKVFAMPEPAKQKPSEVKGQLTQDDSPDQYRDFPGKVHEIELKAGKAYVIDLVSTQFDAYLLLKDANGVLLAQDDDSGGNLNSRLRFEPRTTGRYRLVATTFNGNVGAFTLRVTEQ